ncbi:MAG: radical SAM protein [Treponema sp.]|nr:radical SAM protein [Treponema sp.]
MADLKQKLYEELALKSKVIVEGVRVNPKIFENLGLGTTIQEQIHGLFEMDHKEHVGIKFPCSFTSPSGLNYAFTWDPRSTVSIDYKDGVFVLFDDGIEKFPVEFTRRPEYYKLKTSDGTWMNRVGNLNVSGTIGIAYSNECSLKEKGLDCLFCNANATKNTYAEAEGIKWKTPQQIGETVKAAFELDGAKHINITGGFVPERREVDYYLDVADSIKENLGVEEFNGTAVIGAPPQFDVIDKYKEAGFRTIALQLEIWDRNIFKTICPGKELECGGQQHWIDALEYAVGIFGKGRVRTGFVSGIEPKERTLEGVEYLAGKGILSLTNAWNPNPGSKLEGHRTPSPEWHLDLAKKTYQIFKKAGFTYEQYYDASPNADMLVHDIFKIENELLPIFKKGA